MMLPNLYPQISVSTSQGVHTFENLAMLGSQLAALAVPAHLGWYLNLQIICMAFFSLFHLSRLLPQDGWKEDFAELEVAKA